MNIKEFRVNISGNLIYLAISLSSNAILSYVQEVFFIVYTIFSCHVQVKIDLNKDYMCA